MKDKIIVFTFIGYILFFASAHIIIKDEVISTSERRTLTDFPKVELNSEYMKKLDTYLLEHFPFRDDFRSIKANFNYKFLHKLDNNGIYLYDEYIFESQYPTDKKSINDFINKTKKIESLLTKDNDIYMLVVPDKNYYIESNNFLNIDYKYLYDEINKLGYQMIDIREIMNLNDYYETDTHWKQENLLKVVQKLDEKMNFGYYEIDYEAKVYDKFYGVYYGRSAMSRNPEKITVLTNSIIDNSVVKYLENPELNTVYNYDNLNSLDAYEVYLDGASAFIEIYNNQSNNDKELIVFRDSFGSSLIPLLIPYYSKITVIDNRYMMGDYILDYVEFNNQDVLFLYSTLIINASGSLKG